MITMVVMDERRWSVGRVVGRSVRRRGRLAVRHERVVLEPAVKRWRRRMGRAG